MFLDEIYRRFGHLNFDTTDNLAKGLAPGTEILDQEYDVRPFADFGTKKESTGIPSLDSVEIFAQM